MPRDDAGPPDIVLVEGSRVLLRLPGPPRSYRVDGFASPSAAREFAREALSGAVRPGTSGPGNALPLAGATLQESPGGFPEFSVAYSPAEPVSPWEVMHRVLSALPLAYAGSLDDGDPALASLAGRPPAQGGEADGGWSMGDTVAGKWPEGIPDIRVEDIGLRPRNAALLSQAGLGQASAIASATFADLRAAGLGPRSFGAVREALRRMMAASARSASRVDGRGILSDEGPLLDRDYPEWFLAMPLPALGVTPTVARALEGAVTLADVRGVAVADCLARKGFGRVKVQAFRAAVAAAYEAAVATGGGEADPLASPLLPKLRRSLALVTVRDGAILASRLGLDGPPETLEAIAVRLGVTRERVRQIEARTVDRLGGLSTWPAALARRMAEVEAGPPLGLPELAGDPWAEGLPPHALARLADLFSPSGLWVVTSQDAERFGGAQVLSPLPPPRVEAFARTLRQAVSSVPDGTGYDGTVDAALTASAGLSPPAEAFLREMFRPASEEGWASRMLGRGERLREAVVRLVNASPVPVTFNEVLMAAAEATGDEVLPARLNWILGEERLLLPDGRVGGRGLMPPAARGARIAAACRAAMARAPRRWSTEEIEGALASADPDLLSGLRPGVLDMILREEPGVEDLGRGCWALAGSLQGQPQTVMVAVEGVLERAGGPMRPRDIMSVLAETYGGRRLVQMREGGRVLRVGERLWGLYGRDLVLTPAMEDALDRAVAAALDEGDVTLDVMLGRLLAMGAVPPGTDGACLASLLRLRELAASDANGLLRPADTVSGRPREGSVAADVMALLGRSEEPLSVADIENELLLTRGRASVSTVQVALRNHAVRVETPQGLRWKAPGQPAT